MSNFIAFIIGYFCCLVLVILLDCLRNYGKQMNAALATTDAPALETKTANARWRAESISTAGVDVLATGYSIEVCLWRRAPAHREITRGQKFSSFFLKS
jgi:hypothetical protein